MLNDIGESGHLCLVPDLRGKAFSLHHWECLLWALHYGLYYVEVDCFCAHFWSVFIINRCWILLKAFSASIKMIIWFLSFNLMLWYITLIDLYILKNPCIPGINLTWKWCMNFFFFCFGASILFYFIFNTWGSFIFYFFNLNLFILIGC